jgi:hypothetical protein
LSTRPRVDHVSAHQKNRYGLFIRTIGIARAQTKLTLANLAYNFDRLIFHKRCIDTGYVRLKSARLKDPSKPAHNRQSDRTSVHP